MKLSVEVDGFDPSSDERDQEVDEVSQLIEFSGSSIEILNDAWDQTGTRRDYIIHVYSQEVAEAMKTIERELTNRGFEVKIAEEES